MRGGWRGNRAPALPEPAGREEDRPRDWDGCRGLGMGGIGCFCSHRRGCRQQKWKNCAWNGDLPGSRREPSSPAATDGLSPAVPAGTQGARVLGAARRRALRAWYRASGGGGRWLVAPWSPAWGLVCGVWVTPATDVSCFSDLGCIFVGSAVIWGACWRRWACSGEDYIWDEWVEPMRWGKELEETVYLFRDVFRLRVPPPPLFPFHSVVWCSLNSEQQKGFSSIPFNFSLNPGAS